MTFRYLEDFAAGQIYDLGSINITGDEIIAFAEHYDPQSFHIDAQAAAGSIYGGLIASGWHTACLFMRLLATSLLVDSSSMGSSGLKGLQWLAPVRPDDTLTASLEVLSTRASDSKPDRGVVKWRATMINQDNITVMTVQASFMMGKRKA